MHTRSIFVFVRSSIICTIFLAGIFHCSAATIAWTNTTGGVWSSAANWNPNQVPLPSDDVLITSNGTYTITVDAAETVNTLVLGATNGIQTLSDPASGLTLNNASLIDTNGILFLGGGTLTASNLTVQGQLNWDAGMVTMGGTLALGANGRLNLTNTTTCFLNGVLTNNGTIVMGASNGTVALYGYDPVRIYNNGLWISQSDNSRQFINADGLTNKLFLNTGTFRQTGGGTTTFGWPFTTRGTIDQQAGSFDVQTWMGLNIVHGTLDWLGGPFATNTTLTIAADGTLNLTNPATYYLYGTLTNNGTVRMGHDAGAVALYAYDPARVYNNGLWLSQSANSRQLLNADGLTNKLFFNAGTFQQTSSGTTTIGWPFTTTGTIDQQGGLLSVSIWVGASVLHGTPTFSDAIGGDGATVTVSSTAVANMANGASLHGAVTVDSGGLLNLTNNGTCYLYGQLTNNGTVVMGSADGAVSLYGYDPMRVFNNSLWIAQSANTRQFISADGLTNKLFLNTGTFRQTGNATTLFGWPFKTTGTFDHQGGLLDVQTWIGASVLHGNPIFNNQIGSPNATVNVATNASVRSAANGSFYGALTVDLGGILYLTNSGTYLLHAMLTNNGTVMMGGAEGTVSLYGYDPNKAYNNGLWIAQSDFNRQFISADGLTNKAFVNPGTFRQTGNGTTLFAWPFTTTGPIDQQGGLLDVQTWIGASVLHGILAFNNLIGSPGASVNVAGGSIVRSTANGTFDGVVTVDSGGILNLTNSGTYISYGILTNNGTVVMGSPDGTVSLYGYDPTRVYNNGLWLSQSNLTRQFINADGLTNKQFVNAGTFLQTGDGTTTFGWPFTSSGRAEIQGGTLSMNDLFSQTAGLTLLDGGTLSSTQPYLLLGGSLSGTNTVAASVTNNGVVNPGLPTGMLAIVGNYNQTTNGTLQIDLGGSSPGVTFDQLAITGTAHYGGTLVVSLTNSFVPLTNSLFNIITGGPKVSTFDHFYYPSNFIGAQVVYNGNVTSILVSNAPPRFGPYIYNGNFVAHFYGIPGTNYTVQWAAGLPTTNWIKLTNVVAPFTDVGLGTGVVEMVDPVTISNRFYRTVTPAY